MHDAVSTRRGGIFVSFLQFVASSCKTNRQQAKFMLYTLHLAPDALASKLGCGLLVRRGTVEYDLLPYLVETKKLLRLPSASLSDLLAMQNVRMAKNTTVACKIRRLVCEDEVKAACSEKVIQEILQILDLRDEKKKESKDKDDDKDESEDSCFRSTCLPFSCLPFSNDTRRFLVSDRSTSGRSSTLTPPSQHAGNCWLEWMM